jgi:hypothetical protein
VLTYETGVSKWNGPGSGRWVRPRRSICKPTALSAGRAAAAAHDEYVSDPAKPVPFMPRPVHMDDANAWRTWLINDQRFVSGRPDVLEYVTPALDADVHIMGAPQVDLFASTSGTDSDWVVKLIDVYPDEDTYQPKQRPADGRGVRDLPGSLSTTSRSPRRSRPARSRLPGLPNVDHVFRKGHKIMVQVQSTLPALRPQPADLRAEHLLRQAGRLQKGDAEHPSLGDRRQLGIPAGGQMRALNSALHSAGKT